MLGTILRLNTVPLWLYVSCDWQRDKTLSNGQSAYTNYCGILQQFVQSYISKQQVKDKFPLSS